MQYLGGKSRIAKELAKVIRDQVGPDRTFWDPFCGGLSMSLALGGDGLISDVSLPLISLYRAVASGWIPPREVTHTQYVLARGLEDTDPMKGFCGFGASFGGKYWGGYARHDPRPGRSSLAHNSQRLLLANVPELIRRGCVFDHASFFDWTPWAWSGFIYADPPYQSTTAYKGTNRLDHVRFWSTCQTWVRMGVPVFVSEYQCPVPARVIWEKSVPVQVKGGTQAMAGLERLFQVLP